MIWHLAQIAYEIARLEHTITYILSKRPPFGKTVQDFILKFKDETEKAAKTEEQKELERKARIERSKSAWGGILGRGNIPDPRQVKIEMLREIHKKDL